MFITQMKGNLVKDPSWNSSKSVFELRIAVDKVVKYKDNGDYKFKTSYFNIKFFKDRAIEVANMKLGSGDLIIVLGDYQIAEYSSVSDPNVIKHETEILGRSIKLVSKKSATKTDDENKKKITNKTQLDPDIDLVENWVM